MKINEKRLISYLIVIIPLALVLLASFFIGSFYLEKVSKYFNYTKEQAIKEHTDAKKAKILLWAEQLNLLFEYRFGKIEGEIKKELRARMQVVSKNATHIHDKYKGKKSLKEMQNSILEMMQNLSASDSYLFAMDYNGNPLLLDGQTRDEKMLTSYHDADMRSIVLEEVQMARKNKEGFLVSRDAKTLQKEHIFVHNLEEYKMIVGTKIQEIEKHKELKESLLDMVKNIPLEESDFLAIFDAKKELYISDLGNRKIQESEVVAIRENLQDTSQWQENILDGYQYYSIYSKELDWYLLYGFNVFSMSAQELEKQKNLEKVLNEEFDFIVKISVLIVFFVVILSLFLSRKINTIFTNYHEEVQRKRVELQELNSSQEQREANEITAHKEKDEMLIQQS